MSGAAIIGLALLIWGIVAGSLLLMILGGVLLITGGGFYARGRF